MEKNTSLANAIVELFKKFYVVYLSADYDLYKNDMESICNYYNNIARLLNGKDSANSEGNAILIEIDDSGICGFQKELDTLTPDDFKLFLGNLLDFIKTYKLDKLEDIVKFIEIIKKNFETKLFNSDCNKFFLNFIKDFSNVRNKIKKDENVYKRLFASIKKAIDDNIVYGSDIVIYINKILEYRENELDAENRKSIKELLKEKQNNETTGIYSKMPFEISEYDQNLLQAFYTDEELKNKFDWNRNTKNKSLRFGVENLIDNIKFYENKDSYFGSGNTMKILSFNNEKATFIIEKKNNCGFICDMKKLRWKCNLHNCYIGFYVEILFFESDDLNNIEYNNLKSLEDLIAELKNTVGDNFFEKIKDFKENNENLGRLLEDFFKDNGKAKGWYYQNNKNEIINEFQIIKNYKNTPSTQTNPVLKKANATESNVKKTFMNGHHIIASKWAEEVLNNFIKNNGKFVIFYGEKERDDAPVIMLRDTYDGSSHCYITQFQRRRKDRMNENSYLVEKNEARKELQKVVVSEKDIQNYYNNLSSSEKIELKLLRVWELAQIEKGIKEADLFYSDIRDKIKKYVKDNSKSNLEYKDGVTVTEENIDDRLNKIFG